MTTQGVSPARTEPGSKQVHCRGCGRKTTVPYPTNGHPYGWYTLSVSVPPELRRDSRPYIYLGMFCTVDCLVGHGPALTEAAAMTGDLYERE